MVNEWMKPVDRDIAACVAEIPAKRLRRSLCKASASDRVSLHDVPLDVSVTLSAPASEARERAASHDPLVSPTGDHPSGATEIGCCTDMEVSVGIDVDCGTKLSPNTGWLNTRAINIAMVGARTPGEARR